MTGIFGSYLEGKQLAAERETEKLKQKTLLEQQMGIQDQRRKQAMVDDAKRAELLIKNGDTQGAMNLLSDRAQQSSQSGGNPRDTMQVYNALRAGQPDQALQMITNFRQLFDEGYQAGGQQQFAPSDPQKKLSELNALQARLQQAQASGNPQAIAQAEADIKEYQRFAKVDMTPEESAALKVREARETESAKLDERLQDETLRSWRESRSLNTKIKNDLSIAEKVIDSATQGLMAPLASFASRVGLPVDMTQEGALEAVMTNFAMNELAKFKGPSTDFEFGVSERIGGRLSDSRTSNKAKINLLKARTWLEEQRQRQFADYRQQKGVKPSEFSFDENKIVKVGNKEMPIAKAFDLKVNEALGIESNKDEGENVVSWGDLQ
jgi:hypothetical protein